jgi:hypothetical protein
MPRSNVVQKLVRNNCGSLVVCDDESIRAGWLASPARHSPGLRYNLIIDD